MIPKPFSFCFRVTVCAERLRECGIHEWVNMVGNVAPVGLKSRWQNPKFSSRTTLPNVTEHIIRHGHCLPLLCGPVLMLTGHIVVVYSLEVRGHYGALQPHPHFSILTSISFFSSESYRSSSVSWDRRLMLRPISLQYVLYTCVISNIHQYKCYK